MVCQGKQTKDNSFPHKQTPPNPLPQKKKKNDEEEDKNAKI